MSTATVSFVSANAATANAIRTDAVIRYRPWGW